MNVADLKVADWISLGGIIIAVIAAVISTMVLLQMRQDTDIARHDSELKIRPVLFVKIISINIKDDNVDSIDAIIINTGLGPALNFSTSIAEDISLPGSGALIKRELFGKSSIIQVLPNATSALGNVTANFYVSQSGSVVLGGGINGLAENALQSSSTIRIPLITRPDGQTPLRLRSLGITKGEFEGALNDGLFVTTDLSMTNTEVAYKNRPKRSDTIQVIR